MSPRLPASLWRALLPAIALFLTGGAISLHAAETKGTARAGGPSSDIASGAVELPPFVVSEAKDEKPWRYVESEGFEIISQCDDEVTQQVFAALWRGPRITLPPEFRPNNATPMAVILFNQKPEKATSTQAMGSTRAAHEVGSHFTNVIKRTLHDREIFCINLYGSDFKYSSTFRFDVRTHLALHTPAVPPWLAEALHGNYGIYREGIRYNEDTDKTTGLVHVLWDDSGQRSQAVSFANKALARFQAAPAARIGDLAGPSPFAGVVPPLPVLWNGGLVADNATQQQRTRWAASCALFAFWGLYSENGRYHDAFWRFATRACAEPVTEELFRACFGLGYEEAHHEIAWYMPIAVRDVGIRPFERIRAPKIKLRPATPTEVARLRAEFARGEALVLAERFPDLAAQYRQQTGRLLEKAYRADSGADSRLAALYGLHAFETGDRAQAQELLQAATVAGHARPRAWFALAQLRFAAASAAPAGVKGQLDSAQASSVFIPLSEALRLTPASISNYELLAELWRRTREIPTSEVLTRLEEGQKAFPRNIRLALAFIRVCIERGERQAAIGFIDRSVPFALDPEMRERLEQTRAALAQSLATNPGAR